MKELLSSHFPNLSERELKEKITSVSQFQTFPVDTVLLEKGKYVKLLPLVVKGSIKVLREEEGRELLLYYIRSGESCAMSLTAYLNGSKSEVKAITTEETETILLPTRYIDNWMKLYTSWQQFALALYQKRFEELLQTVDDIAFRKMDARLEKYLNQRFDEDHRIIELTHGQIATDLGTSREVISRLLKQLERAGRIELSRNVIKKI